SSSAAHLFAQIADPARQVGRRGDRGIGLPFRDDAGELAPPALELFFGVVALPVEVGHHSLLCGMSEQTYFDRESPSRAPGRGKGIPYTTPRRRQSATSKRPALFPG